MTHTWNVISTETQGILSQSQKGMLNDVTHLFLFLPASPIRCIPKFSSRRLVVDTVPPDQDGKHQRNQDVHIPIGEMDVVATFSKLMQPFQADEITLNNTCWHIEFSSHVFFTPCFLFVCLENHWKGNLDTSAKEAWKQTWKNMKRLSIPEIIHQVVLRALLGCLPCNSRHVSPSRVRSVVSAG